MKKQFVQVGKQVVHYRSAGAGRPLVLLHASPSSSWMMIPLLQQLAPHFLVIAPDTPGYGLSSAAPAEWDSMEDYAQFLHRFLQSLGLESYALYGTATGAQIAIRYALLFPNSVAHLYLDNCAHFTSEQRQEILQSYFPDLQPQYDASHLTKLWTLVRDMFVFFPWSWSEATHRLSSPFPPASVLHQVALDFAQAGTGYAQAYRAAFMHEHVEHVRELQVPTTLFAWQGSILLPYLEQLTDQELPAIVEVLSTPPAYAERYAKVGERIIDTYPDGASASLQKGVLLNRGMRYFQSQWGDWHYHYDDGGRGPALLILHHWQSSAAVAFQALEWQNEYQDRPRVAVNMPGHGDSDLMEEMSPLEWAECIHELMTKRHGADYEVLAWDDFGKTIADHLTKVYQRPQVAATDPLPVTMAAWETEEYGLHWLKAWYFLRDMEVFEKPLSQQGNRVGRTPDWQPEHLQLKLLAWMKCRVKVFPFQKNT